MKHTLSTSVMHAFHVVHFMAQHKERRPVMVREIAAEYGFPYDSTLRVLRQLAKAQLVTAHRGIKGGFSLIVASSKITILQVIEIILGPLDAYDPLADGAGDRGLRDFVVKDLNKVGDVLKQELSDRTIATYSRQAMH